MIKWRFPSNDHGQNYGINDTGVVDFQSDPMKFLAREILQNSLDAAISFPITIEFKSFEISMSEMPGKDQLLDTFERSNEYWKVLKNDKKTKNFFDKAIKEIKKEKCNFLRISDFNTTGLKGSREELNTDFINLTKSTGASDKCFGSGGSYGIGKYASFACSNFQTVLYSTYDINEEEAYQGVARLVTFKRQDGQTTQGTAFYGNDRNTPVFEQIQLDPNFKRQKGEYGTDIYVSAFKNIDDNWQEDIICSVLDNFLYSIWNNKLQVIVEKEKICRETLENIIEKYRDKFNKGNILNYYNLLTSENTVWYDHDFQNMGNLKIGILLGTEFNTNKTLMVRKTGMKIKEYKRKSNVVPFTAFLYIEGDKINQELKIIENQKHDNWDYKRHKNPNKAKMMLKALYSFVDDFITEQTESNNDTSIDAVGIGAFLPDLDTDGKDNKTETVSDKLMNVDIVAVEYKPSASKVSKKKKSGRRISKVKEKQEDVEEIDKETWSKEDKNENKKESNTNENKETKEKNKKPKQVDIIASNFRFMNLNKEDGKYVIAFVPDENAENGCVDLYLSGEVGRYKAKVSEAKLINGTCEINENVLSGIKFEKGKQVRVIVTLDYDEYCALEVDVYAIKK